MERKCIKCIHFVCTREECSAENTEVCKENYISKGGIDLEEEWRDIKRIRRTLSSKQ